MRWPNPIEWALTAALVVSLLVLAWNFDPFGRRKRAEQRATNAEADATVAQAGTKALDRYTRETIIIREKARDAEAQVRQSPGAETPIDPGRRAELCAALASVRGQPVCDDADGSDELS